MSFSFNADVVCLPWCASPSPRGSPGASLLPWSQQREHRALVFVGFKPESGGLSFSVPIFPPIKGFIRLYDCTLIAKSTFLCVMDTAVR